VKHSSNDGDAVRDDIKVSGPAPKRNAGRALLSFELKDTVLVE
jgi:hypothetical protein